MNSNFTKCMSMLLDHEGGFVNHPDDPGGMTNLGITKATYDDFYGSDIDEQGMRRLEQADVEPIYEAQYWNKCMCPSLPSGVDWAVFDWAVNAGVRRASKGLQKAVEAAQDGYIGAITLSKVNEHTAANIINRIAIYREQHYRSLSHFETFKNGWLRRNDETREQALAMG